MRLGYNITRLFSVLFVLYQVQKGRSDTRLRFAEHYSVHERPPTEQGAPVIINASINLRNILEVAEKEQLISLETTLRLYWKVRYYNDNILGPYCIILNIQ